MEDQLPFFNFSLNKVLACEPDSFKRAKIQIIITIILFSIVKALIIIPFTLDSEQHKQFYRAALIVLVFLVLLKIILYRPASAIVLSHIMLASGVVVIWSNLLIYAHTINIVTIQLIFMVSLVSYYLIGGAGAGIYTGMAILPVVYFMAARYAGATYFTDTTEELVPVGRDLIILLNFVTFVLSHYQYYRAFRNNLEEKEALNRQLEVNVNEAKALAYSRSLFLSTMSHELRTPLNGVIGMAHLLKDSATAEQLDNVNILEFSASNLLAVINDVLDYNKSELDKIELEAFAVNLSVLLNQISSGLKLRATEKGLNFQLELDPLLESKTVITDPTRITQIIYNLGGNAIKFTDEGSVTIGVKIMKTEAEKMLVGFSISDTGIGIASERQEAIFDPFTQASSDTTRKFGGTGLGLAIVKRLLKLFGSTIRVESSPASGSTFTFDIEFTLCGQGQPTAAVFRTEMADMKGFRILIAEDNRINVMLLQKLLSKWDISTVVADNGQEALDLVVNNTFDAVLMDIHMPVMDGYKATMAIRGLSDPVKATIPIIAVTASVSHNLYNKIREAGMQDYINKPFQADQLFEKLKLLYKPIH